MDLYAYKVVKGNGYAEMQTVIGNTVQSTTDERLSARRADALTRPSLLELHMNSVREAVLRERERCAKLAERMVTHIPKDLVNNRHDVQVIEQNRNQCAATIAAEIRKEPA